MQFGLGDGPRPKRRSQQHRPHTLWRDRCRHPQCPADTCCRSWRWQETTPLACSGCSWCRYRRIAPRNTRHSRYATPERRSPWHSDCMRRSHSWSCTSLPRSVHTACWHRCRCPLCPAGRGCSVWKSFSSTARTKGGVLTIRAAGGSGGRRGARRCESAPVVYHAACLIRIRQGPGRENYPRS